MILNSFLDFDSKYFLEIGNLKIAWYAICILTGIILACVLGVKEAKKFGISSNIILDGVLICVPLAIVGARLYYVFTSWDKFYISGDFVGTLLKIIGYSESEGFKLEGLAINGGIIVAILFVIIYCKVRKVNVLQIFDLLAPGLLIGQICGRWGNFFNQEAHGAATTADMLHRLLVPDFIIEGMTIDGVVYMPTFLFESILCLVAFIILLFVRRGKYIKVGTMTSCYLMFYGGIRFFIEMSRTDSLMLGGFKVAQIVSVGMFIVGLLMLMFLSRKGKFEDLYNDATNITEIKF